MIESDIIYLFDTKKDMIKFDKQTLKLVYENDHEKNYTNALLRRKISDFQGALSYLNKSIEQNNYYTDAYNLKSIIYLELNQFDNSMLNFFKSVIIDKEINKKIEPSSFNYILEYVNIGKKVKIKKFRDYLKYFSNYLNRFSCYNEFARSLLQNKRFELHYGAIEKTNYSLFMSLKEKTLCQQRV